MKSLKSKISKTSFGKNLKKIIHSKRNLPPQRITDFENSASYWEKRYNSNNNSGPGSYGRLAEFKADVINKFVIKNRIQTVAEFGCGDGNQLALANYPNYLGLDVSQKAISLCEEKFKKDNTKKFMLLEDFQREDFQAELVLSLDVIFHLVEYDVYNSYLINLFDTSSKYVIIYSSNYDEKSAPHVISRKFTDWVKKNKSIKWELVEFIKNRYPYKIEAPQNTSISDFYIYRKIQN